MEKRRIDIVRDYMKDRDYSNRTQAARIMYAENKYQFSGNESSEIEVFRCVLRAEIKRQGSDNTFGDKLSENKFDKSNWSHGWLKADGASIFIRNNAEELEFDEKVREMIESVREHSPVYEKVDRSNSGENLMILDAADIHIGKLCRKSETGYDYDTTEAIKRVRVGVNGLIEHAEHHGISKIVFVIGNDILHTDNAIRGTTKGTPQDTDGQWFDAFLAAKRVYVEIIEQLVQIADVHVVHCPSNHDFIMGFCLAQTIEAFFNRNDQVTFDCSNQQRKYMVYGSNLIGLCHGDGAKHVDLQFLMTKEARNYISQTRYRYFYVHHGHHKERKAYQGSSKLIEKDGTAVTIINSDYKVPEDTVHVEMVRSPSPPDAWHARNGYVNDQSLECFLHNINSGQFGRFTFNF